MFVFPDSEDKVLINEIVEKKKQFYLSLSLEDYFQKEKEHGLATGNKRSQLCVACNKSSSRGQKEVI